MFLFIGSALAQDVSEMTASLALASILDDVDQPLEERVAAAEELVTLPGGLVFVEGTAYDVDRTLAKAVLPVLASAGPDGYDVLASLIYGSVAWDVRLAAVDTLGTTAESDAGRALYAVAIDEELPRSLRNRGLDLLAEHHPDVLAELGEPIEQRSSPLGAVAVSGASGLTGGILLSSVGVWGRNDSAIAIGAVGGSAIGVAGGGLYAATRPTSAGQGMRYASDVSWGLVGGELLTQVVLDPYPISRGRAENQRRQNKAALLRTLGTGAGTGLGLARISKYDADPLDVMESNLAGAVGMQIGFGVADMAIDDGDRWDCEPWEGGNGCDPYRTWYRSRYAIGLAGTGLGLGLAGLTRTQWDPHYQDHGYAAIVAAESAWAAGWIWDTGSRKSDVGPLLRTTAATSFAATEVFAHYRPRTLSQDAGALYGAVAGNMLGAGIPLLAGADNSKEIVPAMVPAGAVGMVGGTLLAPRMELDIGDMTMIGIGVPVFTAQGAAYGAYLERRRVLQGDQYAGLVLLTSSGSSLALTGLAQGASPRPMDMLALGSASAWGAWYGVMTPIALELDGPSETLLLTGAATSDAFLFGTAAALYGFEVDSSRLFVPQLGAVAGATLGSLGVALVDSQGDDIAKGALIGSVVGFAGGGVAEALRPRKEKNLTGFRPRLDVPGQFGFAAAPTTLDGDMAVYAQLTWRETE
ncbi:MAG: hypothetical protein GY913_14755 [Proteobacteria bacterium]|nr:hypothetical protein [Pseudomonadota bacterium]